MSEANGPTVGPHETLLRVLFVIFKRRSNDLGSFQALACNMNIRVVSYRSLVCIIVSMLCRFYMAFVLCSCICV